VRGLLSLLLVLVAAATGQAHEPSGDPARGDVPVAAIDGMPAARLRVPGGELVVRIAPGSLALPRDRLLAWVEQSARVVAAYYGRFPARHASLLVVPRAGRGVSGGRAWGHRGAEIRITVGEQATETDLARDWVLVHEMVHLAFPSVPWRHHWIEEGLATYVEPIARAQQGHVDAETVWSELAAGLPKGLPQPGDRGLDHTRTWGRTYWGGALFALLADVEIRRRTDNRRGLPDALRAILAAGNIETSSALPAALEIGDRATGVAVLGELYARMKDTPSPVDLDALWRELGVRLNGAHATLDDSAPLAATRRAITTPPPPAPPAGETR
jgi:hypothetical protein